MAEYLPSTPHPNFLDIRWVYFFALLFLPTMFCCFVFATFWCNLTYWEVARCNGDHRMC